MMKEDVWYEILLYVSDNRLLAGYFFPSQQPLDCKHTSKVWRDDSDTGRYIKDFVLTMQHMIVCQPHRL